MAKVDRILEFFPSYYGATNRTKNLYEVSRMLAAPLEEADTLLFAFSEPIACGWPKSPTT